MYIDILIHFASCGLSSGMKKKQKLDGSVDDDKHKHVVDSPPHEEEEEDD